MARRTRTNAKPKQMPLLDIGSEIVPKGSTVRLVCGNGDTIAGTLCAVAMRHGAPFTVDVWDGGRMRSGYATQCTVLVRGPEVVGVDDEGEE